MMKLMALMIIGMTMRTNKAVYYEDDSVIEGSNVHNENITRG